MCVAENFSHPLSPKISAKNEDHPKLLNRNEEIIKKLNGTGFALHNRFEYHSVTNKTDENLYHHSKTDQKNSKTVILSFKNDFQNVENNNFNHKPIKNKIEKLINYEASQNYTINQLEAIFPMSKNCFLPTNNEVSSSKMNLREYQFDCENTDQFNPNKINVVKVSGRSDYHEKVSTNKNNYGSRNKHCANNKITHSTRINDNSAQVERDRMSGRYIIILFLDLRLKQSF